MKVVAPVEFDPMGVVWVEEEASGSFDGGVAGFFWGGGGEGGIGLPLFLEGFGGAKIEVGSVKGPFGRFDLVDVQGGGDLGFDSGANVVGKFFGESAVEFEGEFVGASSAESGIGEEGIDGEESGIEAEEDAEGEENEGEGGAKESLHWLMRQSWDGIVGFLKKAEDGSFSALVAELLPVGFERTVFVCQCDGIPVAETIGLGSLSFSDSWVLCLRD